MTSHKYQAQAGWFEIGDKRHYMKSMWERNIARYLEWLKAKGAITGWEYEPQLFIFEKIRYGTRAYRPDFRVTEPNGSHHWIEVKGFMDSKSVTKLKRMAKYFPNERLVLIDATEYQALSRDLRSLIPGWEVGQKAGDGWRPRKYGLVA